MFTKENTKQIKGIAILLMLAHHLFAFPDRIPYDMSLQTSFYLSGMELTEIIGNFGKICVSLFMFLGGYGLYKRYVERVEQKKEPNQLGRDITKLYKAYWKVLLIFVPMAFLLFSNQQPYCIDETICNRYAEWKLIDFLMNFVGLSRSFNSEWWFFLSYLFTLFEGYVFIELFKNRRSQYIEFGFVVLWSILLMNVFPILPFKEGYEALWNNMWYDSICLGSEYAVSFFVGTIFAKYHIFEGWRENIERLGKIEKIAVSIFIIALSIYVRTYFVTVEFDIVIVPIFIFGCYMLIEQIQFFKYPLNFFGKYSTNMWLVHTFFCYYFYTFAKIVYGSNNAMIAYATLLLLSLGSSILIDVFWKMVGKGYAFLKNCSRAHIG